MLFKTKKNAIKAMGFEMADNVGFNVLKAIPYVIIRFCLNANFRIEAFSKVVIGPCKMRDPNIGQCCA